MTYFLQVKKYEKLIPLKQSDITKRHETTFLNFYFRHQMRKLQKFCSMTLTYPLDI